MRILSNSNFLLLTAGLISGLVFAPIFFLPGLLTISYLCYRTKISTSFRQSFIRGYIFGFGHFLSGLYWICVGITIYIDEFWWAIPFALFGLPIILAFFIAIPCALSWQIRKYENYQFIFSIGWVFFEWIRSWIFSGFPWNLAGYALSFSTTLIQSASIFGIYGLSFIVIYLSSSFYHIFIDRESYKIKTSYINFIIISLALIFYGGYRIRENPTIFSEVNVRLVQPSIAQTSKWDLNHFLADLDKLIALSDVKNGKPDLIIWSEAALVIPYYYPMIKEKIVRMLNDTDTVLITGSVTDNRQVEENLQIYSTMQAISPQGKILFEYNKNHLVPFGEYMPLKKIFPLKKLTPGIMDYSPGNSKLVYLNKYNLWIRPLICYESIFPTEVLTTNKDVDAIINITNDSWYGRSSGPYQHLHISIMRAVESGLPMVRVANNGISAVIDPVGRIINKMELEVVEFLDTKLPKKLTFPTIYSNIGDISIVILVIILLILRLILTFLIKKLFFI